MPSELSKSHELRALRKKKDPAVPQDELMLRGPAEPTRVSGEGLQSPDNVVALQRTIGNRSVQRLLQHRQPSQAIQRDDNDEKPDNSGRPENDNEVDDTHDVDFESVDYNDPEDTGGNDLSEDTGVANDDEIVDQPEEGENDPDLENEIGEDGSGDIGEVSDDDLGELESDDGGLIESSSENDQGGNEDTDSNSIEEEPDQTGGEVDTEQGLGENAPEGTGLTGTNLTLGGNVEKAKHRAKFRSNKSDKLKDQDYQFGAYKGYKGGKKVYSSTTSIIENTGSVSSVTALTAEQYGAQFSDAANNVASAASSGSLFAIQSAMNGLIGEFMPYFKLIKLAIKIPKSIKKTNTVRGHLSALKKAAKASKEKAKTGDTVAQTVYESSKYGLAKVRRQFAERIAKIVIAIVKFATIITDLVTGGTAILFTSIGKLFTGVSNGIIQGISALKSVYKSFKGTKGVNRRKNAEQLINAANSGNVEALHLLYKLKIGKAVWMKQNNLKRSRNPFAKEVKFFSKDEQGYRTWLVGLSGKDWGRMRSELARRLRSTSTKTFTEKRRSMGV